MEEQKIGYVYKITNSETDDIYIGSTTKTLSKRFDDHIRKMQLKPNRKLYDKISAIGLDKFKIELLENVNYKNKDELRQKEQTYINNVKPTLNCYNAFGRNKEKQKAKDKRSYQKHREERLTKVHEYAETHKEEIKERSKLYRKNNKDKIKIHKSRVCVCDICGSEYTHCHKARHERTKKHLDAIPK